MVHLVYTQTFPYTAKIKYRKFETNIPRKGIWGLSPNFHIHVSLIDLFIPTIGLPLLLEEICGPILGLYIAHRYMNVKIGTEAEQFPEKEYIKRISLAVRFYHPLPTIPSSQPSIES